MSDTRGRLVLESGAVVDGLLFGGAPGAAGVHGEVVFNTCMTGYQEVITDPSYAGQVVVMTYPLIGNYGCRDDAAESSRVHCRALVVRELSLEVGHRKAERSLDEELQRNGVPGIRGVDTRALTRRLRERGALRGVMVAADSMSVEEQLQRAQGAPFVTDEDLVSDVSLREPWQRFDEPLDVTLHRGVELAGAAGAFAGTRVVVVDYGVKLNQLRALRSRGADVIVVRQDATLADVLRHEPRGVILANGPGDPARLPHAVQLCRDLMAQRMPLLGICLGHQVLGQAAGATTSRLKFGHHGGNHPVRDERTGAVYVTSQNHEFQVDAASIPDGSGWYVSERNLNDGSVEGLRHVELPAFSVQYHPEGAPGPQDRAGVFDEFLSLCGSGRATGAHPLTQAPLRDPASRVGQWSGSPESHRELAAVTQPPPAVHADGHAASDMSASNKPRCVLVIGSGPVIIGQAAEFDYAGTQAC